jgi:hypothetical protein
VAGFDAASLDVDEPVRRYFMHAIRDGASLPSAVRLRMSGRIRVGRWLPFTAEQDLDGRSFAWRASMRLGPLTLLKVTDRYDRGAGSMEGRLLGRVRVFAAADANTTRSAAGRVALESVTWMPAGVVPARGVSWRVEDADQIVAGFDLAPERPRVRARIDGDGAIRSVWAYRWGDAGEGRFEYLPCGGEVHAEHRFGDFTVPSAITVGWRFGTPRYEPFFEARILDIAPAG